MVSHRLRCFVGFLVFAGSAGSGSAAEVEGARPLVTSAAEVFVSSGTGGASKAVADTFVLFGGSDSEEGKFQTGPGGVIADRQGWIAHDATEQPSRWRVSDFNASTLGGHGAGNLAAWCGADGAYAPGWVAAPGYGNAWNEVLLFEVLVLDPSAGQVVDLDFFFHLDLEPGFDFFRVQYDSAGAWVTVFEATGTNADATGEFPAPGLRYSEQPGRRDIVYAGSDYQDDFVRIRMLVSTDEAFSDKDGLYDGSGAVQVDDIHVSMSNGDFDEDFESGSFRRDWYPQRAPIAGSFFEVYAPISDIDPCRENSTPVGAFIDAGQIVNNWWEICAGPVCVTPILTGGTTSSNWTYGFPGGWVVNHSGGVTFGEISIHDQVWTPEIEWNLPTTEDDAVDFAGALLSFDLWEHLPYENGMFWTWAVRSSTDGGETYGQWRTRSRGYFGKEPRWRRIVLDMTDLLPPAPDRIQVSLGVIDLADELGLPGEDATPSPVFDNVRIEKYGLGGPVLSVRAADLPQDGFPASGAVDATTLAARDELDVRFDRAESGAGGASIVAGDSVLVSAWSAIDGAVLVDLRMHWILEKNAVFEDQIRQPPSGIADANVDISHPDRWTGEVVASPSKAPVPAPPLHLHAFDLPDQDFLYPGDRLRVFFRASDDAGRVTTLPADTTGFRSGRGYPREFGIRALPTILATDGAQPPILVDVQADLDAVELAMGQLGYVEGIDYDAFVERAPESRLSNGLGSAGGHGATALQLAGYRTVVVSGGRRTTTTLSDGTAVGENDASDDVGVLSAWHELEGDRVGIHFGDGLVSGLVDAGGASADYATLVLGARFEQYDVSPEIGAQHSPVVVPVGTTFGADFALAGGCPDYRHFDSLRTIAPARRGHAFRPVNGGPGSEYPDVAASVVHERAGPGGERRLDFTFPFGLGAVVNRSDWPGSGMAAAAVLLGGALLFAGETPSASPTSAPEVPSASLAVHPNPFNPRTAVHLTTPERCILRLDIFDLRGRRVRRLHTGPVEAGPLAFEWDGTDDAGAAVASGVYVVRAATSTFEIERKIALVR